LQNTAETVSALSTERRITPQQIIITLSSKPTFSENLTFHLSVSVCRTDLMAVDRFLDLIAHQFLRFSFISLCFSYSYVRHTKFASSLVNIWAHDKIV